jgi:hypothetical protein
MAKPEEKKLLKKKVVAPPAAGKNKVQAHGKKNITAALEALGDWDDTEETSFGDVPEGTYQVKVESVTINNAKSSGRLQVSWDLVIVSGEQKGRHIFTHQGIEDVEQRGFLRGALAKLGVEWPKASELRNTLSELEGTFAEVKCKTKANKTTGEEFFNTYFQKALDTDEVEDAGDLEEGGEERGEEEVAEDEAGEESEGDAVEETEEEVTEEETEEEVVEDDAGEEPEKKSSRMKRLSKKSPRARPSASPTMTSPMRPVCPSRSSRRSRASKSSRAQISSTCWLKR